MKQTLSGPSADGDASLLEKTLHQGDCVEWLGDLPAGSIDLVFADPPFNIDYTYDVYDDARSDEDYLAFCKDWITGVYQSLKDDGTFWLAIGDEYAAELKILSQQIGFHCRSWVIWYYTFGVNNRKGFSRSHTHLFHFVKHQKRYTFNLDNPAVRVASARQLVYADKRANTKGRLPDNTWILRPQDAPPGSFATDHDTWFYSRVAGTFKEREGFHGCQMPEQLLGRIIRLCSDPGDIVADPFAGSGTTLATAKKLARRPVGCELSGDYVGRIDQRLQKIQPGDPLDGAADSVTSAPATAVGRARTDVFAGNDLPPISDGDAYEIRAAYDIAGSDVSPRRMLCDPDRRAEFAGECKRRRVSGDARLWNHHLLRLIEVDESFDPIDTIADAAEAALKLVMVDYGLDRDGVLCSDAAIDLYDELLLGFAGNDLSSVDPADARLAMLPASVRRRSTTELPSIRFQRADRLDPAGIDAAAGVYLLRTRDEILYVGHTAELRRRLTRVATTPAWNRFAITGVAILPGATEGHRAGLVRQHHPYLNVPPPPVSDTESTGLLID